MGWRWVGPLYQKKMRPSSWTRVSSTPVICALQACQRREARSCSGVFWTGAQAANSDETAALVAIIDVSPRHRLTGGRSFIGQAGPPYSTRSVKPRHRGPGEALTASVLNSLPPPRSSAHNREGLGVVSGPPAGEANR